MVKKTSYHPGSSKSAIQGSSRNSRQEDKRVFTKTEQDEGYCYCRCCGKKHTGNQKCKYIVILNAINVINKNGKEGCYNSNIKHRLGCAASPSTKTRGKNPLLWRLQDIYQQDLEDVKYPLLKTKEIFSKLNNGESFTKLDLSNAHSQIEPEEESARFVPKLAMIMKPIYELLRKEITFDWNERCQKVFQKIKELLIASDQVLTHFGQNKPIAVSTDASQNDTVACLAHKLPNGDLRPVAFISRTLAKAEEKYSIFNKEALAIYWAVKMFYFYLMEQAKFTTKCDHKPLLGIYGQSNEVADRLSRHALQQKVGDKKSQKENYLNFVVTEGLPTDYKRLQEKQNCTACLKALDDPQKTIPIPRNRPQRPWQRIHLDFLKPFQNTNYLVIPDAYSKWPEIFRTPNISIESTIKNLRKTFSRWGLPERIVSDNGPSLVFCRLKKFLEQNGIKHITSSPFHPATNGAAENAVRSFNKGLKAAIFKQQGIDPDLIISRYLLNYRNEIHFTTNETPAVLTLGRNLRTCFDLIKSDTTLVVKERQEKQVKHHKGKENKMLSVEDKDKGL
ncbi:hypothetical protein ILUMI_07452 [Ignelater luminosus]|uniref:Integrase catalytic domain-containing protein n=1 Tax=Ignelater luminosus TaxID=2038154 RepID=A0A8K0GBL5_IGNLU|nr:hypothetical protein ILUMI_07452 [Ignelater luminosus]